MKKIAIIAASALLGSIASAQITAFAVQNGWNNNTGTFSYSGTYPSVTMSIDNQNNTALNNFGERFIAWLSTDGITRAKINGRKDFSIEYTITMATDAAAVRDVEGGLLFQYDVRNPGPNQYFPTSQFYAKFRPQIEVPSIRTSSDWVMPGYDFVEQGATLLNNQTVMMKFEYDYNDAAPLTSVQRLSYRGADQVLYESPWINGNWGGPVYDAQMELGIYFQPLVEAANPNHDSSATINIVNFTGTLVAPPGAVTGTVGLMDWSDAVNGRSVTFRIYSGTTLVDTKTATLNSSGAYTFNTALANGNYTMIADAGRAWLRKKVPVTITAGAATGNFVLPNGDINDDGVVDLTDYTRVALAFNALPSSGNWDAIADINADLVVDLTDYTAIAVNFNALDETP